MDNTVSIEQADEDDAVILAEISKEAFHTDVLDGIVPVEWGWKLGGPPGYDSPKYQKFIMSVIDGYKFLLDDEIVGGIYVNGRNKKHCILERIFIKPELMNRGIASKAIEKVHAEYPEADIWTLGTPRWNKRTRHFYEKHGYVQVGWDKAETPDHPDYWGVWYQKSIRSHQFTKVNQLVDGTYAISIEGTITGISPVKTVKTKNGKIVKIATAELADDTGKVDLVAWENNIKLVSPGMKARIENGNVTSYRGKLQLNVNYGRIIELI